jgi:exonuclease VII large subunit
MKSEIIQLLNPKLLLNRGFSIITDENQQIILSPTQLKLDDMINVQVANGKFVAKVIKGREDDA